MNGDVGFVASGARGVILAKLVSALKKPKPINKALNADLETLIGRLENNPEFLEHYPNADLSKKGEMIRALLTGIPILNNQWIPLEVE